MNLLKKSVAALGLAIGLAAAPAVAEEEKTIKMGVMQWETMVMTSSITEDMLERHGFEVETVEFQEWGVAFAALGKGDIDIMVSHPDYAAADYWERNARRLEKLNVVSYGYNAGLIVPSYVTIDSIDELNDHKEQFGGRIIGVEPGSGMMRQSENVVREYGLDYEIVEGSGPVAVAALKSAIDRKEWIVSMYWTPSWVFQEFDIKFLKDPKSVQEPTETYVWLARQGFSAEHPKARESIASVFVPEPALTQMTGWVKDGASIEEAVTRWKEANANRLERQAVIGNN
ncbi:glycine betaine ABC transporter substrate-binding protein [Aureimonas fodinaquatilis]|uniref:Glycine betaine ABC transporter substrate-binding protein n=1 Tax=Aureimonas fodinaquatilis TaxID=2565783 RepID=A0A5B0E0D2_9HYPH|nr:glycine betaine ABC transporter substrate-binding protein [Aureimonas fodinaquatilis]KAA0971575.1 glycine betaine ABC transporter substrate-binding protein [Aureimonas fodinaquatilis]